MTSTPKKPAPQAGKASKAPVASASGTKVAEGTVVAEAVRRKPGAPLGSRNAMRHGLRAGQLPKNAKHVEIQCNVLRRQLEDSILTTRHQVTLTDAAHIATALRWERHGALCLRWLRLKGDDLKPEQYLKFSEGIAKASAERDKAIRQLNLDAAPSAPWLCLDVKEGDTNDQ